MTPETYKVLAHAAGAFGFLNIAAMPLCASYHYNTKSPNLWLALWVGCAIMTVVSPFIRAFLEAKADEQPDLD